MASKKAAERTESIEQLRKWLKPGDTVYTILRHVSKSGMSRVIGNVIFLDGSDLHPNHAVAVAIGAKQHPKLDGVKIGGCGMDMGFHMISTLSRVLFPKGFGCIGKGCPSNDHSNGDRDYTPHVYTPSNDGARNHGHWHKSGDYALRHRWL